LNFYPHHIGDYLTATAHLSWVEDCAYRRLLDLYYSREQAIPADLSQAARLCRAATKEERKAVETVLGEFFTQTEQGWMHPRCEEEIAKASEAAERARSNGKRGGRPPKQKPETNPEITQSVSAANPEESKSKAPNPITNTNTSEPNGSGGKPPTADEIIFGYGLSLLTNAGTPEKQARSFLGGLRKSHPDEAIVNTLRDCIRAKPLQPLEWLAAALPPGASRSKPNAQEALEAQNREVARRFLEKEGEHVA
jgi:uncharacterized protein YdaU (DUF1376 family)